MLKYFENSNLSTTGSDTDLAKAQSMENTICHDSEIGVKYMSIQDIIYFEKIEAENALLEKLIRKIISKGFKESDLPELLEETPERISAILKRINMADKVSL